MLGLLPEVYRAAAPLPNMKGGLTMKTMPPITSRTLMTCSRVMASLRKIRAKMGTKMVEVPEIMATSASGTSCTAKNTM